MGVNKYFAGCHPSSHGERDWFGEKGLGLTLQTFNPLGICLFFFSLSLSGVWQIFPIVLKKKGGKGSGFEAWFPSGS